MGHGTGAPQRGRGIEEALFRLFGHQDTRTVQQRLKDVEAAILVETLVWYSTSTQFSEVTDQHPAVPRLRELIKERRDLIRR